MQSEPAATMARALLVAASLVALVWSSAVVGLPGRPDQIANGDRAPRPKVRSILADLVFKNSRRSGVPTQWPANGSINWSANWQDGVRPRLVDSRITGGIARVPLAEFWLAEFWLLAPSAPLDWQSP